LVLISSNFGLVAVNTPRFKDKIIPNCRRFLRFEGGWHPIWLEWENRFDILVGASADEGYFFVRKMNSAEQPRLLEFLDEKLFSLEDSTPCKLEDIGFRERCFKEILTEAASNSPDNSLILIPVNNAQIENAMNLYCSLKRQGMHRYTLFMSFDYYVHSKLVERKILSYYNPVKIWGVPEYQPWHRGSFSRMMRQKPIMWYLHVLTLYNRRMLIDIGVSFWQFDADTVVIQNFNGVLDPEVDVHLSIDGKPLIFNFV
jgi:hypothetical protein